MLRFLLLGGILLAATPQMSAAPDEVNVDPEVRQLVSRGPARVLVELRVADTGGLARVQDQVLARLPRGHAALARRYSSIPLLGLEIDAVGLRSLEGMSDLVVGVKPDRVQRPQ